jgi:hypothetical protein
MYLQGSTAGRKVRVQRQEMAWGPRRQGAARRKMLRRCQETEGPPEERAAEPRERRRGVLGATEDAGRPRRSQRPDLEGAKQ